MHQEVITSYSHDIVHIIRWAISRPHSHHTAENLFQTPRTSSIEIKELKKN